MKALGKKICVFILMSVLMMSMTPLSTFATTLEEKNNNPVQSIVVPQSYGEDLLVKRVTLQEYDFETHSWVDTIVYSETYRFFTFRNGYVQNEPAVCFSEPYEGDGWERQKTETFTYTFY